MTTQPTRRPRPTKPEEPQAQPRLAPAFDRDALALSFLYEKHHISRAEFRANLRLLGVRLEDEEPRHLPVPTVVRVEATYPLALPDIPDEPEEDDGQPPDQTDDEWWKQLADETEG
jgi:hypothetical protein